MTDYERLPLLARTLLESILRQEPKLLEIAGGEADGEAGRLLARFGELRALDDLLQAGRPADLAPFLEALEGAAGELGPGDELLNLAQADEWQRAFFYLKEMSAAVSRLSGLAAEPLAIAFQEAPPETETALGEAAPAEESDGLKAEEIPPAKLADLLPRGEGPTVYLLMRALAEAGSEQNMAGIIKMLLDKSPPLMGEAGKPFFCPLELNFDKAFSVVEAAGDPELTETLGLAVTLEEGQVVLRGQAPLGYDGELYFSFARQDRPQGAQILKKPLYIAADPRSLWRDLPVEDDEGYPADNEDQAGRELPELGKVVLAASCRGRSHAHAAKPRDDSFLIEADGSGWNLLAVADGAGSSRYSRKGSALACETVVETLRQLLASPRLEDFFQANAGRLAEWKRAFEAADGRPDSEAANNFHDLMAAGDGLRLNDVVYKAVYEAHAAIEREARDRGAQVRDYHSTLLCAAFRQFSFGYFIISYWVGDGAMAVYNWNGRDRVLVPGQPDGGEFAGQTRFLTMGREEINPEAVARRTRYIFADDFEALILATDGVSDPFFPSEKSVLEEANWRHFWTQVLPVGDADAPPCPELFDGAAAPPEQAGALRRWLNFWSKGNHDDRTILIVK